MAVLIRHRAAGITPAQYDQISPPLLAELKGQPGFVLHVAFEDSQGFCVAEIWDTKEQHDSYFNEKVVPNVPAEIKQEVINLHNVFTPQPRASQPGSAAAVAPPLPPHGRPRAITPTRKAPVSRAFP